MAQKAKRDFRRQPIAIDDGLIAQKGQSPNSSCGNHLGIQLKFHQNCGLTGFMVSIE